MPKVSTVNFTVTIEGNEVEVEGAIHANGYALAKIAYILLKTLAKEQNGNVLTTAMEVAIDFEAEERRNESNS